MTGSPLTKQIIQSDLGVNNIKRKSMLSVFLFSKK